MASEVTESEALLKAWVWFEEHRKQVSVGLAIVLVAACIAWFVVYQQDQQRIAAGESLSNVALPQVLNPNARPAPDGYLRVAARYPDSRAAAEAVLLAGAGLFDQGKYSEARAEFERFRRDHRDSALIGEALLGIAACFDAEGRTAEAINAYRDIVEHHPRDAAAPQASFALGRLYEAVGQYGPAQHSFEDVLQADPYGQSSLGSEAGMRLEELKRNHPELFAVPSTPLPTNGPTFNIQKQ